MFSLSLSLNGGGGSLRNVYSLAKFRLKSRFRELSSIMYFDNKYRGVTKTSIFSEKL